MQRRSNRGATLRWAMMGGLLAIVGCGDGGGRKTKGNSGGSAMAAGPGAKRHAAADRVSLTYPPVVTDKDLAERGNEMLAALVRTYEHAAPQYRKNFQTACNLVNDALKSSGAGVAQVRCEVINHPDFNANTLPGGIIVATTSLVVGYTNLAAAQVLYQRNMKDYLAYNDTLAMAMVKGVKPEQLPLPACPGGGSGCLERIARSPLFLARVTGLLAAIAAHEIGHVRSGHVLNEFLRKNVEQFNNAAFAQMTGRQVDAMFTKVKDVALSQVDEYWADESAAKFLGYCHDHTARKYYSQLKDRMVGPHPMDAFYTLWFLMSMDRAARQAGRDKPAYQKNHPPARLRAQRVLQVIVKNRLPSHELARAASAKLFGGG